MVIELSEFESIFFYAIVLCTGLITIHYADKKNSKFLLWAIIIVYSLIIGFRYGVGRDYYAYKYAYDLLSSKGSFAEAKMWYDIESSYIWLCLFAKSIGANFTLITLFYGFFTTFFYLNGIWFFRREIRIEWAFISYSYMFFGSFNTMRQYLAMAIVFFAFRYVIERKPIKYFAFVVIAMLFHSSAVIAILIYFYGTKKSWTGILLRMLNYILPVILVVGTNEIFKFIQSIGGLRFESYTVSTHFGFGIFIQIGILYLFKINARNKTNSLLQDNNKFYFVNEILIASTMLCILDYTLGDASRIRNYFSVIEMIAMASYSSTIFPNNCNSKFPKITYGDAFLLAYHFMFLVMSFINRDPTIYPYSFCL